MNFKVLFLFIGLTISYLSATAQDTLFNGRRNKIGFTIGQGFQYIGQLNGTKNRTIALATNYYYKVDFYQLQYYFSGLRKKKFGIDILVQPQYNTTKYKYYRDSDATPYLTGHEAGVNLGFLYRWNFTRDNASFYISVSTGPHFISGAPDREVPGFVFSNNFNAGINLRVYKNLYADLRAGIRHASNLGFKVPNAGLNDLTLNEGFVVVW